MNKDIYYYLGFSHCLGIGPVKFKTLLDYFSDVKKAYLADEAILRKIIGSHWAEKFIAFRANFDPVKKMEELKKKEIEVIPLYSTSYPESLKNISDPPICLYVRRDIDSASDFFHTSSLIFLAIVGTRKPTPYGEQIAKKFAYELADAGFVIVSGMAMGIDAVAHQAALEAGGKTIAVLGCGVDIIYPAVNTRLYQQIIESGGAIISEFPPGHTVLKGLFIARNRIISGLSKGVLVVEGLKDSGALITARYAAEQGKEVFAPPGPLTSEMSEAPNILLKQGAKLVISVEDIIEELGLKIIPKKKEEIASQLESQEKIIFEILEKEPLIIDEIALQTKKSINEILNIVSLLEIKGVIEKNSEGKYQIKL